MPIPGVGSQDPQFPIIPDPDPRVDKVLVYGLLKLAGRYPFSYALQQAELKLRERGVQHFSSEQFDKLLTAIKEVYRSQCETIQTVRYKDLDKDPEFSKNLRRYNKEPIYQAIFNIYLAQILEKDSNNVYANNFTKFLKNCNKGKGKQRAIVGSEVQILPQFIAQHADVLNPQLIRELLTRLLNYQNYETLQNILRFYRFEESKKDEENLSKEEGISSLISEAELIDLIRININKGVDYQQYTFSLLIKYQDQLRFTNEEKSKFTRLKVEFFISSIGSTNHFLRWVKEEKEVFTELAIAHPVILILDLLHSHPLIFDEERLRQAYLFKTQYPEEWKLFISFLEEGDIRAPFYQLVDRLLKPYDQLDFDQKVEEVANLLFQMVPILNMDSRFAVFPLIKSFFEARLTTAHLRRLSALEVGIKLNFTELLIYLQESHLDYLQEQFGGVIIAEREPTNSPDPNPLSHLNFYVTKLENEAHFVRSDCKGGKDSWYIKDIDKNNPAALVDCAHYLGLYQGETLEAGEFLIKRRDTLIWLINFLSSYENLYLEIHSSGKNYFSFLTQFNYFNILLRDANTELYAKLFLSTLLLIDPFKETDELKSLLRQCYSRRDVSVESLLTHPLCSRDVVALLNEHWTYYSEADQGYPTCLLLKGFFSYLVIHQPKMYEFTEQKYPELLQTSFRNPNGLPVRYLFEQEQAARVKIEELPSLIDSAMKTRNYYLLLIFLIASIDFRFNDEDKVELTDLLKDNKKRSSLTALIYWLNKVPTDQKEISFTLLINLSFRVSDMIPKKLDILISELLVVKYSKFINQGVLEKVLENLLKSIGKNFLRIGQLINQFSDRFSVSCKLYFLGWLDPSLIQQTAKEFDGATKTVQSRFLDQIISIPTLFENPVSYRLAIQQCHGNWVLPLAASAERGTLTGHIQQLYSKFRFAIVVLAAYDPILQPMVLAALNIMVPSLQSALIPALGDKLIAYLRSLSLTEQINLLGMATKQQKIEFFSILDLNTLTPIYMTNWTEEVGPSVEREFESLKVPAPIQPRKCRFFNDRLNGYLTSIETVRGQLTRLTEKLSAREYFEDYPALPGTSQRARKLEVVAFGKRIEELIEEKIAPYLQRLEEFEEAVKSYKIRFKELGIEEEKVPEHYICIISREVMREPVLASDGFVYDKESIEQWIAEKTKNNHLVISPRTNQPLASLELIPEDKLKKEIEAFQQLEFLL